MGSLTEPGPCMSDPFPLVHRAEPYSLMSRSSLTILALVCYAVVFVSDADSVRGQTRTLDLAPSVETISGAELEALIERDFIAYDPDYLEHRRVYGERLHVLASRLAEIQATANLGRLEHT